MPASLDCVKTKWEWNKSWFRLSDTANLVNYTERDRLHRCYQWLICWTQINHIWGGFPQPAEISAIISPLTPLCRVYLILLKLIIKSTVPSGYFRVSQTVFLQNTELPF
jgi:hypothetical protein